jgi:putative Ca2+/H+ antiporter (TMEM165/GDT1 family)
VAAGDLVSRVVSPVWLRRVAGVVFVALGALFLTRRGD